MVQQENPVYLENPVYPGQMVQTVRQVLAAVAALLVLPDPLAHLERHPQFVAVLDSSITRAKKRKEKVRP
jgi:hypothetical protein